MFKKFLLPILGIIPFIFIFLSDFSVVSEYKNIEIAASFQKFDYNELKNSSDVIALVEVKDDLTKNNSVINYAKNSPAIQGFYGRREVKVLKYYKDKRNLGKKLSIIEPAAITKKNEYLHCDEYSQMVKGNKYIVFLSDETASGELSVLSGSNGKINVSDFDNNEFYEILVKSLVEFESEIADKDKILSSKPIESAETSKSSRVKRSVNIENKLLKTNFGDLKAEYYPSNNGKQIIRINGILFECGN